jgi:O-antigen/teichoic acid export membrane protein
VARSFLLLSGLAVPATALMTSPLLARTLGVADRGRLAAAQAVLALATSILAFGLHDYALHRTATEGFVPNRLRRRGRMLGVVAVVSGAVVFLSTESHVVQIVAIATPLALAQQWIRSIVLGLGFVNRVAWERLAQALLRLTSLVLLVVVARVTLMGALLVTIASSVLPAVLLFPLPKKRLAQTETTEAWSAMWAYGIQSWISTLATAVVLRFDQLLLAAIAGSRELGLYAVAVGLTEAMLVISSIWKPVVQAAASGPDAVQVLDKYLGRMRQVYRGLALPILAASPFAIPLVYGREYSSSVVPFLVLFAASYMIVRLDLVVAFYLAGGKPKSALNSTFAAACVTVLLAPPLCYWAGAVGAAAASFLAYSTALFVAQRAVERPFSIDRRT